MRPGRHAADETRAVLVAQVLDVLPDAVLAVHAATSEVVYANAATCDLLGAGAAELCLASHPGLAELVARGPDVVAPTTVVRTRVAGDRLAQLAVRIVPVPSSADDMVVMSIRELHADPSSPASFLAEASNLLSSSLDYDTTLQNLARLLVPHLADWCSVDLLEADGTIRRIVVTHADPTKAASAQQLAQYAPRPHGTHPLLAVLRTGESQLFTDLSDRQLVAAARDSRHLRLMRDLGHRSAMIVPLRARGRTLGAVTLVRGAGSEQRYRLEDLVVAEDLARRAGLAVDNAGLHRTVEQARRRFESLALTLQESLLPSRLPTIPGIELAGRYQAAGTGVEVGGDFYDVFALDDGRVGVVIGDVCGQGAEAAALTALARHTVQAAAVHAAVPSEALEVLNQAIIRQDLDGRFLTVAYAVVEPRPGAATVTIASGGHPLPTVLRSGDVVHAVGRPGSLLGLFDDIEIADEQVELRAGDALVLYTDGVTEARRHGVLFGEQRLRSAVLDGDGTSAEAIADRIRHAALEYSDGPVDDIAILVLRVSPTEDPPAGGVGDDGASVSSATSDDDLAAVADLFAEYRSTLEVPARYHRERDRIFGEMDHELDAGATLAPFLPPRGGAALARANGEPVGAVGVAAVDDVTAELKHLYVRPSHRGRGLGRSLALAAIRAAGDLGYERLRLETVDEMEAAVAIYRGLGFVTVAPFTDFPDARFLELRL